MHHDHDEELGMYWYSAREVPPPPAPIQPRRVKTATGRPRDKQYWEQTFDLTLEYLRLQAGTSSTPKLDEDFLRWLMQSPGEMHRFVLGDDTLRAEQADSFLKAVRNA
jgi:hypothetical protein